MINTIKMKRAEGLLSRIMRFLAGYTNTMAVSRLLSFALACVFSLGILFSLNHCSDSASPDPPGTKPSDPPGDDHGNDRDSATPITNDAAVIGNIETGDDEDYFSIRVTERGILRASTIGVTDTTGAIYDSAGEQLASHDDIDVDEDNKNFDVSYRVAAGVYYVRVSSFETNTGKYRLTVTFTPDGADDHFNTPAHATPVTSGMQVAGNIETGDDQDYFSIEVPGAGTIQAITTGMTDTIGYLYNNAGDELAMNDNGDTDMNFDIVYNVVTAGTYYVRVMSVGSVTGMYRLTVTFTLGGIDDHGNDRNSATPIDIGTMVAGDIETSEDDDYFSIEVPGAGTLTAMSTGMTDTLGYLYDSDGNELASDISTGNFNISSYKTTGTGTYYIRVRGFGGDDGEYGLIVTFIPDDHGNTQAHATPVTSGTAVAGNIETGDDQDYFSIAVSGAGTITASTTGSTDTMGILYNRAGNELARDDDSVTNTNFDISHYVTAAGTYYVRVISKGTGTGMYSLTVTFIPDDHSNVRASATPATSGTTITGNIETGDDQDYFSIAVSGAGTITAITTGSTDTVGHLYNNRGTQLATDDNGGTGSNFNISSSITAAGTYYLRVTSKDTGTGMYDLTVTFIPDDHGNDIARATRVMSGTQVAGNIETGDDQDYFSIAVNEAGTITTTTTGSTDTIGHLYSSSGTQLATDDDGGTGSNFNISSSITAAGTYYVRVASKGTGTGMYRLTVTFTPAPPPSDVTFMYPELNYSLCGGSIQITPTLTTDIDLARISVAISPDLPSGIQISSATGEISGTYSGYHSQSYVVKVLLDSVEETQTNLNLKINAVDQISYPQEAYQFTTDAAITVPITIDPSHPGVAFSVSPALPSGLSLNSSTGQITGRLSSELGNQDHLVQVVSDGCQHQIPLTFCANEDGNCPPRFLSSRKIHYADVADAVFPTDATVDEIIKDDKKSAGDHLESRYIGIEVKSFVDDNADPFTITIVSQTNNNSHPRRTSNPYSYKYRERSIDSAGANKVRKLYFFDGTLTAPSSSKSLTNIQLHRFHKFTTDTLTLRATDGNGRSTEGTIEIRRSPKLKDCTGLTGKELNECTWLSEILPSGWENNTLTDAVKNKLPNLTQDKDNYRLVFAEEFNGDGDSDHHGLDRSKWRLQGWAGWENNPDANRDDCFFQIEGGTLQMSWLYNHCVDKVVALHTLGILEYKYGYLEIKFKLPVNKADYSYYTNYAGVLWGRYANKYYHTTPVVVVDSIEKYLKYEVVEWDLYEYVAEAGSDHRRHSLFGHWYYINANDYSNFHIPTMQLDRTGALCYINYTLETETDAEVIAPYAKSERVFLEGCNSALATTKEEAPMRDKFITLTRGWEWTPKGYRTFSHYESDNANDKAKYPDLFSDGLKTSSWQMYWFKYTPYTSKTGFTRSTTATNIHLSRAAPNLTNRDTEDQLVEIGVMHQPGVLELVVWGRNNADPPANTIHPHVFHIDYVRLYKPVDNYKDVAPSYKWAPTLDERCTDTSMC